MHVGDHYVGIQKLGNRGLHLLGLAYIQEVCK